MGLLHQLSPLSLVLAAGVALSALGGCVTQVDQRGNLPDPKVIATLQPGVTDKATVTRLLGSPSSVAAFDGDTWYYISQRTESVAFFTPDLVDQQVVAIDFNKDGLVQTVRHRGLEDRREVELDPHATPAAGREFSLIEQLIGNFGKFTPSSSGK